MPAHELTETPIAVPQYAMVGTCNAAGVAHAAILCWDGALVHGTRVTVLDCAPPLQVGSRDAPADCEARASCALHLDKNKLTVQVAGWIADLPEHELEAMHILLHELQTSLVNKAPSQVGEYLLHPSYKEVLERQNGRCMGLRCSCVGFVLWLYERGTQRVPIDQAALPLLKQADIEPIWPDVVSLMEKAPMLAKRLGLNPQSDWPLLLPGYLLHALALPADAWPYRPKPADKKFP